MKTTHVLQFAAITMLLALVSIYPAPALSQTDQSSDDESDCLTSPRETLLSIRRIYNCTDETAAYREFDNAISKALEQPNQRDRFSILNDSTNDLLSRIRLVSQQLETKPASLFIQSVFADLQQLSRYFSNPESVDFLQTERILLTNRWAFSNQESDGHLFTAYATTERLCTADNSAPDCLSAIAETGEVASLARLANRINTVFHDQGYELAIALETDMISTLASVEANTPFQYPWELTLNRRWLDCALEGRRNSDFTGASGILTKVPDCHFILLHPDAAFGYSPESTEGAKSTEALVIELAGFMKYKFQNSAVKNAWGMSIATTLADLEGNNNDVGLGLTFRYGKFGLTASKHRGEMLYLLNLELFDIVAEKTTDFSRYINQVNQIEN